MWSGPRNISTALMRSFGNRPNTFVVDEPFYAHYLLANPHIDHPGRDEIIRHHDTDPQRVIAELTKPLPGDIDLYYQKHMCQHMIEGVSIEWLSLATHVFLIRNPRDVIRSFAKVMPDVKLEDIGLARQLDLYNRVRDQSGQTPVVIDSDDVLERPEAVLRQLCDRVGLEFSDKMLSWTPGPREYDGVWAKYWYSGVNDSTKFERRTPTTDPVPTRLEGLVEEAMPYYEKLARQRVR